MMNQKNRANAHGSGLAWLRRVTAFVCTFAMLFSSCGPVLSGDTALAQYSEDYRVTSDPIYPTTPLPSLLPSATPEADPEATPIPDDYWDWQGGALTASGDGWTATLTYRTEAKIPDGAVLTLTELKGADLYNAMKSAAALLKNDADDVWRRELSNEDNHFFTASITDPDGNTVQPQAAVALTWRNTNHDSEQTYFSFGDEASRIVESADGTMHFKPYLGESFGYGATSNTQIGTVTQVHEGSDYMVTASYGPEAGFPAGTELKVREIMPGTAEYATYSGMTDEALGEDWSEITLERYFDIAFVKDGKELEPQADIDVQISFSEKIELTEEHDVAAVHIENNEATVIETETESNEAAKYDSEAIDTVAFTSDSFSVYGVVQKKRIINKVLEAGGNTYEIELSYTQEAEIPENAQLVVEEIPEGSDLWEAYRIQTAAALKADDVRLPGLYDISIVDEEGNKVEPKAAVNVAVKLLNDNTTQDIQIVHFTEEMPQELVEEAAQLAELKAEESTGQAETTEKQTEVQNQPEEPVQTIESETIDAKVEGDTVTFEAESFSVYAFAYTIVTYFRVASGETYKITLKYDEHSGIPSDSTLQVSEILPGNELFDAYLEKALHAAKQKKTEESTEIDTANAEEETETSETMQATEVDAELIASEEQYARFFDIVISNNGEKVEPTGKVSVIIELADMPDENEQDTLKVVHFGEFGTEILDAEINTGKIQFESVSFSVYGVIVYSEEPESVSGLDGRSCLISHNGKYLTSGIYTGGATKQFYKTSDKNQATVWTFETVPQNNSKYTIYTYDTNGDKQYMQLSPRANDSYHRADAGIGSSGSWFTVEDLYNGKYRIYNTRYGNNYYLNEWANEGAQGFAGYYQGDSRNDNLTIEYQDVAVTSENYAVVVKSQDGDDYYVVKSDGTLQAVDYDPETNRVKMDYPLFWQYTVENVSGTNYTNLRVPSEASGFQWNNLPSGYYYRYIDPNVDKGFTEEAKQGSPTYGSTNAQAEAAHPNYVRDCAVRYENQRIVGYNDKYLGIDESNMCVKGLVDESNAAIVYLAKVDTALPPENMNHTVNHIDISIKGGASLTVDLPYNEYYYYIGGVKKTLVVDKKESLLLKKDQIEITPEDMKQAKITAYSNKSGVLSDVFYITGYSQNKENDTSTSQVRLEGSFKVADLDPYVGKNEGSLTEAELTARLNNRIYYTVTVNKQETFDWFYTDPDTQQTVQLYDAEDHPLSSTVMVNLSKSFDYWNEDNECPPIKGKLYGTDEAPKWRAGHIIFQSKNTDGSGMDFILEANATLPSNSVAIAINKKLLTTTGEKLNPDSEITNHFIVYQKTEITDGDVSGVANVGVEGGIDSASYSIPSGYSGIHIKTLSLSTGDESGVVNDYDVDPGMVYIKEDQNSIKELITDTDGKEWKYVRTYIETEYAWRQEGDEDKIHVAQGVQSIPEVLGNYGSGLKNSFLHFTVYNVYAPVTEITAVKQWSDGNENHLNDQVTVQLYKTYGDPVAGSDSVTLTVSGNGSMPSDSTSSVIVTIDGTAYTLNQENGWTKQLTGITKGSSHSVSVTGTAGQISSATISSPSVDASGNISYIITPVIATSGENTVNVRINWVFDSSMVNANDGTQFATQQFPHDGTSIVWSPDSNQNWHTTSTEQTINYSYVGVTDGGVQKNYAFQARAFNSSHEEYESRYSFSIVKNGTAIENNSVIYGNATELQEFTITVSYNGPITVENNDQISVSIEWDHLEYVNVGFNECNGSTENMIAYGISENYIQYNHNVTSATIELKKSRDEVKDIVIALYGSQAQQGYELACRVGSTVYRPNNNNIVIPGNTSALTFIAVPKSTSTVIQQQKHNGFDLLNWLIPRAYADDAIGKAIDTLPTGAQAVGSEVTLDASNDWTYTWTDLPKTENIDGVETTVYYSVIETWSSNDSVTSTIYTTTKQADDPNTDDLESDRIDTVTITNNVNITETGDLQVSKTVSGSGSSTEDEFEFTVTLQDITGVQAFNAVKVSGGSSTDETITFIDGIATFKLMDGESLTIKNLPADTAYTVNETESYGYTTTTTGNTSGTIPASDTATVAFNNNKENVFAHLVVNKDVVGYYPVEDFSIAVRDDDGYYYATDGTKQSTTPFYVTIKRGTSETWSNLNPGTYTINELEDNEEGFALKAEIDEEGSVTLAAGQTKEVTVTNTYSFPMSVTATKEFDSAEPLATAVQLTLMRQAGPEGKPMAVEFTDGQVNPATVTEAVGWETEWHDLDRYYNDQGMEYSYFVTETGVYYGETIPVPADAWVNSAITYLDGSSVSFNANWEGTVTIRNKEKINVPVTKNWADDKYSGSEYTWTADFQLQRKEVLVKGEDVSDAIGDWVDYSGKTLHITKGQASGREFTDLDLIHVYPNGSVYRILYRAKEIGYEVKQNIGGTETTIAKWVDGDSLQTVTEDGEYEPYYVQDAGDNMGNPNLLQRYTIIVENRTIVDYSNKLVIHKEWNDVLPEDLKYYPGVYVSLYYVKVIDGYAGNMDSAVLYNPKGDNAYKDHLLNKDNNWTWEIEDLPEDGDGFKYRYFAVEKPRDVNGYNGYNLRSYNGNSYQVGKAILTTPEYAIPNVITIDKYQSRDTYGEGAWRTAVYEEAGNAYTGPTGEIKIYNNAPSQYMQMDLKKKFLEYKLDGNNVYSLWTTTADGAVMNDMIIEIQIMRRMVDESDNTLLDNGRWKPYGNTIFVGYKEGPKNTPGDEYIDENGNPFDVVSGDGTWHFRITCNDQNQGLPRRGFIQVGQTIKPVRYQYILKEVQVYDGDLHPIGDDWAAWLPWLWDGVTDTPTQTQVNIPAVCQDQDRLFNTPGAKLYITKDWNIPADQVNIEEIYVQVFRRKTKTNEVENVIDVMLQNAASGLADDCLEGNPAGTVDEVNKWLVLSPSNDWQAVLSKVPISHYDTNKGEYEYYIVEVGYKDDSGKHTSAAEVQAKFHPTYASQVAEDGPLTSVEEGHGMVLKWKQKNYLRISNTIDVTSIPVEKDWTGGKPDKNASVEVELVKVVSGEDVSFTTPRTLILKANEDPSKNWKGVFGGLDKTDSQGHTITYKVKEKRVVLNGMEYTGDNLTTVFGSDNKSFTFNAVSIGSSTLAIFKNPIVSKTLTVTKQWNGSNDWPAGMSVTFSLTAKAGTYTWEVPTDTTGKYGADTPSATVSSTDANKTVTWTNLPKWTFTGNNVATEIEYSVAETAVMYNGEDVTAAYDVTHNGGLDGNWIFNNTPKTGSLKIEKTVTLNGSRTLDQAKTFYFTVKDSEGNYYYKNDEELASTKTVPTETGSAGVVSVASGSAGITLTGLPIGNYTVSEVFVNDVTINGYKHTSTTLNGTGGYTANVTVVKDDDTNNVDETVYVRARNDYERETGSLKIMKTLSLSDSGTLAVHPTFTFTVKDSSDNYYYLNNGELTLTTTNPASASADGIVTVTAGDAGVTLNDLPVGDYTVTEVFAGDVSIAGYAYTGTIMNPADGRVSVTTGETPVTVTAENSYTRGSVSVSKTFIGKPDTANMADFKITMSRDDGAAAIELKTTGTQPDNVTLTGEGTEANPYVWMIVNLPIGTKVTFTEDGYGIAGYNWTGTVSVNGADATNAISGTVVVDAAETHNVAFNNTYVAGAELPATGGSGTLAYTLGGLALILVAGALWMVRKRRKA